MFKNYKELKFWKRAYAVCIRLYQTTAKFPAEERYGLTSQIKRSAVSIPSNIAEGYGRRTTSDYIRFPYIAYGSLCELETQIMLASDLKYVTDGNIEDILMDISECGSL